MTTLLRELALLEFVSLLADATVKASALLVLAAIVVLLSRRATASFRHLVWTLALGCVLVLPLLSRSLPHWHLAVGTPVAHVRQAAIPPPRTPLLPSASVTSTVTDSAAPKDNPLFAPSASESLDANYPTPSSPLPIRTTVTRESAGNPWTQWAVIESAALVWLVGFLLTLARIGRGAACLRAVAKDGSAVPEAHASLLKAAIGAMRVNRHVTLLAASAASQVAVPITWGALRPVIVIPPEATDWPQDKLSAALLHEMAHVRRWDCPLQTLAQLACAMYWFNPLVWLAARGMRAESEAACDDLVLTAGVPAAEYARHLLDVALRARDGRRVGAEAVAMAQTPRIEGRLRTVLAAGLRRGTVRGRVAAGTLIAALLLALPLAALRLTARAQSVPEADRLQLGGDFTLRYAATVTDLQTVKEQYRLYQQIRADYNRELSKNPFMQPVPAEYYAPFSYFQKLRPRTRHLILTVSARNGQLLWRCEENGHTFALLYNGRNGTQLFSDGFAGHVEPGLSFSGMTDCPLPAVGLPHIPLLTKTTLLGSSASGETWSTGCPQDGAERVRGEAEYNLAVAHAVTDGGVWKLLDLDSLGQRFQFLQHQRFQGLWVASHMTLTKYADANQPGVPPLFSSTQQLLDYADAHRIPASICEYRLLSASSAPLDLSAVGMRKVSAAPIRPISGAALQHQQLDDFNVQEALHLRFHFQDWARIHEALLRQMGRSAPRDFSAASAVDQSLRALPFPLWQGGGVLWDGDPRIRRGDQKPLFTSERLRLPSGTARDFVIARSRDTGASHVSLWASGRITRLTVGIKGQEEIVPEFFGTDGTENLAGNASPI